MTFGCGLVVFFFVFHGEFDPGSGRTLAACFNTCKSNGKPLRGYSSGERVSNTWVICPKLWDKAWETGSNTGYDHGMHVLWWKAFCGLGWARGLSACWWGNGHQGDDG